MVLKCGYEDLKEIGREIRDRFECPRMKGCKAYIEDDSLKIHLFIYSLEGHRMGDIVPQPCVFQSKYRRLVAPPDIAKKLREGCKFFDLEKTASD